MARPVQEYTALHEELDYYKDLLRNVYEPRNTAVQLLAVLNQKRTAVYSSDSTLQERINAAKYVLELVEELWSEPLPDVYLHQVRRFVNSVGTLTVTVTELTDTHVTYRCVSPTKDFTHTKSREAFRHVVRYVGHIYTVTAGAVHETHA